MASQLDKKLLSAGNNKDYPKVGDEVTIEYTGWLHDPSKANKEYKGNQYVISGWQNDLLPLSMAVLTIPHTDSIAQSVAETSRPRLALVESSKVLAANLTLESRIG